MAKSAKKPAPVRSQAAVKPLDTAKKAKAAKPTSAASGLPGPAAKASDSDGTRSRTSNRAFSRCCNRPQGRRSRQ